MEQSSGFENSGFASKRKRTRKSTSLRKFGQRNGENNRTGLEEISPSIEVTTQSCFTFGNSRPFFHPAPATASLSDCIQESKPANSFRGGNVHAHSQIAVHFRFRCTPIRNAVPRSTHRAFWRLHLRARPRHLLANSARRLRHHRLHYHVYYP